LLEWSDEGIKKQRQFLELPLRLLYLMLGFSRKKRKTERSEVNPFEIKESILFDAGSIQ
jgi:hypothetical protein